MSLQMAESIQDALHTGPRLYSTPTASNVLSSYYYENIYNIPRRALCPCGSIFNHNFQTHCTGTLSKQAAHWHSANPLS